MKIGIFTGATSVRSKNVFTDISRYPPGEYEIKHAQLRYILVHRQVDSYKYTPNIGEGV